MSLVKAMWLERRELKEEDSGPEGGVMTWPGDFVGQSRELSLSAVGRGRDKVFPSVVGATRLPRAVAAHQGALQTPPCPAWLGMRNEGRHAQCQYSQLEDASSRDARKE